MVERRKLLLVFMWGRVSCALYSSLLCYSLFFLFGFVQLNKFIFMLSKLDKYSTSKEQDQHYKFHPFFLRRNGVTKMETNFSVTRGFCANILLTVDNRASERTQGLNSVNFIFTKKKKKTIISIKLNSDGENVKEIACDSILCI